MSKLFDDENEDFLDDDLNLNLNDDTEDEDEEPKAYTSRDKIFENDYNTGNLDFEEYNLPRVETSYAEQNLRDCYDSYEYNRKINLEVLVDEYFKETEYGKIFAVKRKLPKQSLPHIFESIRVQFKGNDYTGSEIFSAIADYFGINYEVLYQNIPSVYRAELVKELDDKFGILKKKGLKRLF